MRMKKALAALTTEQIERLIKVKELQNAIASSNDAAIAFAEILAGHPLFEQLANDPVFLDKYNLLLKVKSVELNHIIITPCDAKFQNLIIRNPSEYNENGLMNIRLIKFMVTHFRVAIPMAIKIMTSKTTPIPATKYSVALNQYPHHIAWRAVKNWMNQYPDLKDELNYNMDHLDSVNL